MEDHSHFRQLEQDGLRWLLHHMTLTQPSQYWTSLATPSDHLVALGGGGALHGAKSRGPGLQRLSGAAINNITIIL